GGSWPARSWIAYPTEPDLGRPVEGTRVHGPPGSRMAVFNPDKPIQALRRGDRKRRKGEGLRPEEGPLPVPPGATSGGRWENDRRAGMRLSRPGGRMTALAAGMMALALTGAGDAPHPDRPDVPPRPGRSPDDCVDPRWTVDAASPEVWSDP